MGVVRRDGEERGQRGEAVNVDDKEKGYQGGRGHYPAQTPSSTVGNHTNTNQ
jgi:hypothetical protein